MTRVAMPSPRGTNRARLFLNERPSGAAYDAMPEGRPSQKACDRAVRILARQGVADSVIDGFLSRCRPDGAEDDGGTEGTVWPEESEYREDSPDDESRNHRFVEARDALDAFARDKLQPDDLEAHRKMIEALVQHASGGDGKKARDELPTYRRGLPQNATAARAMDGLPGLLRGVTVGDDSIEPDASERQPRNRGGAAERAEKIAPWLKNITVGS